MPPIYYPKWFVLYGEQIEFLFPSHFSGRSSLPRLNNPEFTTIQSWSYYVIYVRNNTRALKQI
jgi:hypothetical protein